MRVFIRYEQDCDEAPDGFTRCIGDESALREFCSAEDAGDITCLCVCKNADALESTVPLVRDLKGSSAYNVTEVKLILYYDKNTDPDLLLRHIKEPPCNVFIVYGAGFSEREIFETTIAKQPFSNDKQLCVAEMAVYRPELINLSNIYVNHYLRLGLGGSDGYDFNPIIEDLNNRIDDMYKILDAVDYSYLARTTDAMNAYDVTNNPFSGNKTENYGNIFKNNYSGVIDTLIKHNVEFKSDSVALKIDNETVKNLVDKYAKGGVSGVFGQKQVELYESFAKDMGTLAKTWYNEQEVNKTAFNRSAANAEDSEKNTKDISAYAAWLRRVFITKYIKMKKSETKVETCSLIRNIITAQRKELIDRIKSVEPTELETIFAKLLEGCTLVTNRLAVLEKTFAADVAGNYKIDPFGNAESGFCSTLKYLTDDVSENFFSDDSYREFKQSIAEYLTLRFEKLKALLPHFFDISTVKDSFQSVRTDDVIIVPKSFPEVLREDLENAKSFETDKFFKFRIHCIGNADLKELLTYIGISPVPAGN
jgi:hypothetical protein